MKIVLPQNPPDLPAAGKNRLHEFRHDVFRIKAREIPVDFSC